MYCNFVNKEKNVLPINYIGRIKFRYIINPEQIKKEEWTCMQIKKRNSQIEKESTRILLLDFENCKYKYI